MKRITTLFAFILAAVTAGATIPPHYYDAASGKKKADLKTAMHNIIGHANTLSYGSGSGHTWWGFYETDRMPNNQVRDRYSNVETYFTSQGAVPGGLNIEHSFAKSWWGGSKNQAYKDIHHLMPCESKINSSKSNYGMGKVTNVKTDNGCTKVGTGPANGSSSTNLWEPADQWKGDFARVYMYMVTCYQNLTWSDEALKSLDNNDWPTFKQWAIDVILEWSAQDPVDAIEIERNEKVFGIQGNRNPFIDFPNLGRYIWGDSINYAFDPSKTICTDGGVIPPVDPENPDDPNEPVNPGDPETLLNASFATGMDGFTCVTYEGGYSDMWEHNSTYKCILANAFNKGKEADAWAVSPEVDLTGSATATLTFEHATGFNETASAEGMFTVCVSTDYEGIPANATWQTLTPEFPDLPTSSFTKFVKSGELDLSAYAGQKITLAFRYQANAAQCWAWEIKNLELTATAKTDGVKMPEASDEARQAVYSIDGTYVGNRVPNRKGLFIIRRGNRVIKAISR